MSAQASATKTCITAWVHGALVRFADGMNPGPIMKQLNDDCSELVWSDCCVAVAQHIAQRGDALASALADIDDQIQQFVVALVGLIETDYLTAMALSELQQSAQSERPQIFLLQALVNDIFTSDYEPEELITSTVVESGIVSVQGTGPLVTRELAIDKPWWLSLSSGRPQWPGTRLLHIPDEAVLPAENYAQLDELLVVLARQQGTLVIRGALQSGRMELAACIAERVGLKP